MVVEATASRSSEAALLSPGPALSRSPEPGHALSRAPAQGGG